MKHETRQFITRAAGPGALLATCLALAACGGTTSDGSGGQSAGIGGTGIVYGKVTGFGSIFVNGTEYNTDDSKFIVDGDTAASQVDLALGMVVRIEVETKNGKLGTKAIEVDYDDEVQGPVAGISTPGPGEKQRTFDVFGQTITIDETSTIFKDTTFLGLADNDVVEISGFRTSSNTVTASYVEKKGTLDVGVSEVELRGTISGYLSPAMTFMLDGFPITFDNTTDIKVPGGTLENGQYVEVSGIYQAGPSIYAKEIEFEDEGFGDNVDDASLQGIISEFSTIDDEFKIDGLRVDASGAELTPANAESLLANGVEIEVDGKIVGGVLIAEELELREGDSRLKAVVDSVDLAGKRFEVSFASLSGTVTVLSDSQTTFEDEISGSPLENMSLADLLPGDFVEVEGITSGGSEITAKTVKRRDTDDTELGGMVDGFDTVGYTWITVLGITYDVDPAPGGTEFEGFPDAATFFGQLNAGVDSVEIRDDEPANGTANQIEEDN